MVRAKMKRVGNTYYGSVKVCSVKFFPNPKMVAYWYIDEKGRIKEIIYDRKKWNKILKGLCKIP